MATLKDVALRLRSVKNIQKITKSMKMVSAAKFARAERDLKSARSYGEGAAALYKSMELDSEEKKPNHMMIALCSDRGLCGAVHSSICRTIKADLAEAPESNTKLILVGDKARAQLQRLHRSRFLLVFTDYGRKPPQFIEAAHIAREILNNDFQFETADLLYNKFRSVISYETIKEPLRSVDVIANSEKILSYDDVDHEVVRSYQEFALANSIYAAMKDGAASEQSARMTAMDNASKNAGEMIDSLTLTYNRTRQAVITRELIEIISGAAALE
ncbi:expressed hypothetical protein [Trichoplax adhaerens]|uniref:ATP synthase subunit gamma n=1 Tax=Trichoplax adhaerens TaxID=10228 RepID=B3RI33_TRIAD|nr:expressed hypothetical protein [Trichoplax adhaerens]EDV28964.1 expressed hypothetical protein [Trichoplax adhaerens]|eukprot:XP_002108166.1 expressed hypothetical protein [Trichoplax adhaerens]